MNSTHTYKEYKERIERKFNMEEIVGWKLLDGHQSLIHIVNVTQKGIMQ